MNLLSLTDCVIDQIFEYLSYDEIAKKRLVSSRTNRICQSLLNRGALKLKAFLSNKISKLKPLLPRKESERWENPAAKKLRYLESIQFKVHLLYYVYEGYISTDTCCFIPGKFIDITFKILRSEIYPRSWPFDNSLNELTDASCMAKENFRDKIEPPLKKRKAQRLESPKKKVKIDSGTDLKVCQFQDGGNCRKAYNRLNNKYKTVKRKLDVSNKNYDSLLKQFKSNKKVVMNKLTHSRKEVTDLRRRLEKLESNKISENKENVEQNSIGEASDLKMPLRSSKRLRKN